MPSGEPRTTERETPDPNKVTSEPEVKNDTSGIRSTPTYWPWRHTEQTPEPDPTITELLERLTIERAGSMQMPTKTGHVRIGTSGVMRAHPEGQRRAGLAGARKRKVVLPQSSKVEKPFQNLQVTFDGTKSLTEVVGPLLRKPSVVHPEEKKQEKLDPLFWPRVRTQKRPTKKQESRPPGPGPGPQWESAVFDILNNVVVPGELTIKQNQILKTKPKMKVKAPPPGNRKTALHYPWMNTKWDRTPAPLGTSGQHQGPRPWGPGVNQGYFVNAKNKLMPTLKRWTNHLLAPKRIRIDSGIRGEGKKDLKFSLPDQINKQRSRDFRKRHFHHDGIYKYNNQDEKKDNFFHAEKERGNLKASPLIRERQKFFHRHSNNQKILQGRKTFFHAGKNKVMPHNTPRNQNTFSQQVDLPRNKGILTPNQQKLTWFGESLRHVKPESKFMRESHTRTQVPVHASNKFERTKSYLEAVVSYTLAAPMVESLALGSADHVGGKVEATTLPSAESGQQQPLGQGGLRLEQGGQRAGQAGQRPGEGGQRAGQAGHWEGQAGQRPNRQVQRGPGPRGTGFQSETFTIPRNLKTQYYNVIMQLIESNDKNKHALAKTQSVEPGPEH